MAKKRQTITEALREAIEESGMSHRSIATATGVERASIYRFVRGDQSIRLDVADKLCEFFNLEVRKGR